MGLLFKRDLRIPFAVLLAQYLSNPTRDTEIRSETFHDVDTGADHERAEQLIDRSVDSAAKRPD